METYKKNYYWNLDEWMFMQWYLAFFVFFFFFFIIWRPQNYCKPNKYVRYVQIDFRLKLTIDYKYWWKTVFEISWVSSVYIAINNNVVPIISLIERYCLIMTPSTTQTSRYRIFLSDLLSLDFCWWWFRDVGMTKGV